MTVNEFCDKYRSVITPEQFDRIIDVILGIKDQLEFTDEEIAKMDKGLAELKAYNYKLSYTAEKNNTGITYEKAGMIDEAIKVYEENIAMGFPASHAFDRLMIIYRRLKRYDDEIRVIYRTMEVYKKEDTMSVCLNNLNKRLLKVMKLKDEVNHHSLR